jgi:hydroxypyruvate isomerase
MPDIKISAADWCYYTEVLEPSEYYDRLAHMGFSGAEMVAPERMDAARAAGLELVNVNAPGMTEGLNRREHHARLVPQIRETIGQARENGVPQVIVFSGNRAGQDDAEGLDNVVRGLEQVLPDAESAGIVLTFEMLNGFDHPDYQADYSQYGFDVVKRLPSPSLKLIYDIYHMARVGEDVYAEPVAHLADIAIFHVAEVPHRTPPVELGETDFRTIVHSVRDAGYDGYWGIEFIPSGPVMEELAEAAALFLSFSLNRE